MDYFPPAPKEETLLSLLSDTTVLRIVQQETAALEHIVNDIESEIKKREHLEQHLLDELEDRRQEHASELLNLRTDCRDQRRILLEDRLEIISKQTLDVKIQTFRDTLELKKLLWHYWLTLQQKTAQRYLFP